MRRQAIEVHQFPEDKIFVVGALQFVHYDKPVSADESNGLRQRLGLGPADKFLTYVCGARTSEYDIEDILAMIEQLNKGPFKHLKVVVRPHPQGSKKAYKQLSQYGVILDQDCDLTSADTPLRSFDYDKIRHMAAIMNDSEFVISSWGTTALLEACIFDTPAIQLRWMDTVCHKYADQVQKVRDFHRYLHMRSFDETGAKVYSDSPRDLELVMNEILSNEKDFRYRRLRAREKLIKYPLGSVNDRVCNILKNLCF